MSRDILVSILIPSYNAARFLKRSINSCIHQTHKNIEIIIVNDGSTDSSIDILDELEKKDERIKIYHQDNKGVSATRNRLVSLANGHYFFFLDADDTIPSKTIENLVLNSNEGMTDIVIGRAKQFYNFSLKLSIAFPFIPTWIYHKNMTKYDFVKSNMCLLWGYIIKREFFLSLNIFFNEQLKYFEDISVATLIFLKSQSFKEIPKITYHYNRGIYNKDNMSHFQTRDTQKMNDFYFALRSLLNSFEKEKFNSDKKIIRSINGSFFPILTGYDLLIKSLTTNYVLRSILRNKIISLIHYYNYEISFSKTWWKSLLYFYILNSFKNYVLLNEVKKVCYINEIKNKKSFFYGCYKIKNFLGYSRWQRSQNMFIVDFNFIKKNKNKLKMKRNIFFLLKINQDDCLDEISSFLKQNDIIILGFSLEPFTNMNDFFKLFPNTLFIDFNLRFFDEKMISSFVSSFSKISPNISLSITIKKDRLKNISNTNLKIDFLFIEDENA
ncbi:MAG: glycosyltransferase family 2 protein [Mycoplasmoidaceae bacterium]